MATHALDDPASAGIDSDHILRVSPAGARELIRPQEELVPAGVGVRTADFAEDPMLCVHRGSEPARLRRLCRGATLPATPPVCRRWALEKGGAERSVWALR